MGWLKGIFAGVAKRQGSGLQSPDRAVQLPPPAPNRSAAIKAYCDEAFCDKDPEDRKKATKLLLDSIHCVDLLCSDTFAFACADSESMDMDDFELLIPIIAKYGHSAFTAYIAVKRDMEPIKCKCHHDRAEYHAARKEIEALRDKHDGFFLPRKKATIERGDERG